MGMKARHVHRTTCFVQSSLIFFYKIQNDGHHLEKLCTRFPPAPPQKDVLFHQTKISLFNSSCLLLTGNKSNTAGRKSVDLKKTKTNKQTKNKYSQLNSGFWTLSLSKNPYTWCDYATHEVFTLYFSWWGHKLSTHHTNVYKIATLRSHIFVIFQQNTYKGCVPLGESKKGF